MSENESKKIPKSKDYDETRYHTEGNLYQLINLLLELVTKLKKSAVKTHLT